MFSVCIPSMWRAPHIEQMLPRILDHPLVHEVIFINNNIPDTPNWFHQYKSHPKLKIHTPLSNLFVNPSWNYFVSVAEADRLCFCSDDIGFDVSIFDQIDPYIIPTNGLFGMDQACTYNTGNIHYRKITLIKHEAVELPLRMKYLIMYGTLMFIHKWNFEPIPDVFKIFYGDVWMYAHCHTINKPCYTIGDFLIITTIGTTSLREEMLNSTSNEHYVRNEIFKAKVGFDPF